METRFALSARQLDIDALSSWLRPLHGGAFVVFEGRGRETAAGRVVRDLEYEAYEPLALREGERILASVEKVFDVRAVRCVHRTGRVRAGEAALWVGVTGPLQDAAFRACSYVVEEIRRRVPIWKKEHYADGSSMWAGATLPAEPVTVRLSVPSRPRLAPGRSAEPLPPAAGIA